MKIPIRSLRQAIATAQFPDVDIQNEATAILHEMSILLDTDILDDILDSESLDNLDERGIKLLNLINSALIKETIDETSVARVEAIRVERVASVVSDDEEEVPIVNMRVHPDVDDA